jgi:hypothetical protein
MMKPDFRSEMEWYDPLQERKGGATKVKVPEIGIFIFYTFYVFLLAKMDDKSILIFFG